MMNLHRFNCQAFTGLNTSPEVLAAIEAATGSRFQTGCYREWGAFKFTDGDGFNDRVRDKHSRAYSEWANSYKMPEVVLWLLERGIEINDNSNLINPDGDELLWGDNVLEVNK